LVYNIVGRALGRHHDVDDVVQETLLRAVRDLPALRDPNSFRSWLVAIAIHQIRSHQRRRASGDQLAVLDETVELPQVAVGFEDLAILRLHVSDQRRQVAEAGRWLDAEHRVPLALWWQENAGWLARRDVAAALGLSVAHTGVRLQRMRDQLEVCRAVVAALGTEARCRGLEAEIARWDGQPTPLWRKRIVRHVRQCSTCGAATSGQIPIERLLLGFAPLAVPVGLAAGLTANALAATSATAGGGLQATLIAKLAQVLAANPIISLGTGAALVAATTVTYATIAQPPGAPPAVIAAPTPRPSAPAPSVTTARAAPSPTASRLVRTSAKARTSPTAVTVPLGTWSLESVAMSGQYLTYAGDFATLAPVAAGSDDRTRRQATLTVVPGLADAGCVTFRASDGRYLRHSELRLRLNADDSTRLFREDATFCPLPGAVSGSVALQAHNYRALVLRYRDGGVYIDVSDGTTAFARQSSFFTRKPWAR
jgi:RNA polymerase sigma factor (sigma-70 family)